MSGTIKQSIVVPSPEITDEGGVVSAAAVDGKMPQDAGTSQMLSFR